MKKCTSIIMSLLIMTYMFFMPVQTAYAYSTVRSGSSGSDVKTLQIMLNKVDNAGLTEDGKFGPATEKAVKSFQSRNGLDADGIAGTKTWTELEKQYQKALEKDSYLKNGSSGDNVKTLQKMLNKVDSAGLTEDGKFGPATETAVRNFQSRNGLSVDGIVGPETMGILENKYQAAIAQPEQCNVMLEYYSGCTVVAVDKNSSYKIQLSNNPHREGYTFIGWSTNNSSSTAQYYTGDTITITKDITLFAVWKENAKPTPIPTATPKPTDTPTPKPTVTPTPQSVVTPNDKPTECKEHSYTSEYGSVCTECGYVYDMVWTPYEKTMVVVNTGAIVRRAPYQRSGEAVYELAPNSVVQVKYFIKNSLGNTWFVLEDGNFIYKDNLSLKKENCIITYDANGGVGAPSAENLSGSSGKISSMTPSRQDYRFVGWSTDISDTYAEYMPGEYITVQTDITLYAVWEEIESHCLVHNYSSAGGDVCNNCGYVYVPKMKALNKNAIVIKNNSPIRTEPYSKRGETLAKLEKYEEVKIAYVFENSLGNKWFRLSDGNYIYSENVKTDWVKCTLTYSANAGGAVVKGMPDAAPGIEGFDMEITSANPARVGYLFKGWSKDANASTVQYTAGNKIVPNGNITLYAVWEKTDLDIVEISEEIQGLLDKTEGFPQVKETTGKKQGLCTSCATALMIKRKQIVDGKNEVYPYYDFYDVRMSLGLSKEDAANLYGITAIWKRPRYSDDSELAKGFTNEYSGNGEMTFWTDEIKKGDLGNNTQERKENIIALIASHPEGIVLYTKYPYYSKEYEKWTEGNHAIVLTGYESETDTFYACDSVDVKNNPYPVKIDQTFLYRTCGSLENILDKLISVWYITDREYR